MSNLLHLLRGDAEPGVIAPGDQVVYSQGDPDAPFSIQTAEGRRPLSPAELVEALFDSDRVVVW